MKARRRLANHRGSKRLTGERARLAVIFLLTGLSLGFLYRVAISRGTFEIQAVRIVGACYSDPSEILSAASPGLEGGLIQDFRDVRSAVERMPLVRRAEVDRLPPDRVIIRVEEKEPIAILAGGIDRPIDRDGWILPIPPVDAALDLPIIQTSGPVGVKEGRADSHQVLEALGFLNVLGQSNPRLLQDISVVSVGERGDEIRLTTARRNLRIQLDAGEATRSSRLLEEVMEDIERKGLESCHIDLRYKGQAVVHLAENVRY